MQQTPLVTASEVTDAVPSFGNLSSSEQASLIAAATSAINQETDRYLGAASYDQVYRPGRSRILNLRQFPVSSIARLATDLNTVMTVQGTSANFQEAYLSFTATGPADDPTFTGIALASVTDGVATTTPLTFASHPTVGPLAAAIDAVPGWTAAVTPGPTIQPGQADFARYACANLIAAIGMMDAFTAPLQVRSYTRALPYRLVANGEWTRQVELFEGRPDGFRYPDRSRGIVYGAWASGSYGVDADYGAVRALFQAGYQTADVPGDIKFAAVEAIQFYRDRLLAPGAFKSKSVGKVSYTIADLPHMPLPEWICKMLLPHRRVDQA